MQLNSDGMNSTLSNKTREYRRGKTWSQCMKGQCNWLLEHIYVRPNNNANLITWAEDKAEEKKMEDAKKWKHPSLQAGLHEIERWLQLAIIVLHEIHKKRKYSTSLMHMTPWIQI